MALNSEWDGNLPSRAAVYNLVAKFFLFEKWLSNDKDKKKRMSENLLK